MKLSMKFDARKGYFVVKAKFHYGAGSELVRSWFEAKFHYAIWIEPASNQLRTSSEPAPNRLRTR